MKAYEVRRDLAALIAGLVAGTGARGLKMREIQMLVYHVAKRLGKTRDWGFEATPEGPRSRLVEQIVDELLDAGVLTWRFDRSSIEDPYYAIVEPEAVEWIPSMREFSIGFEEADNLFHRARISATELEAMMYLLHREAWSEPVERLERLKARVAARLAARGLLGVEEAAHLAGISVEEMRRMVEEAREEVELGLPLEPQE